MSIVAETLIAYLPPKRKTTPSGWISFDAPCCTHNGETRDTKARGGVIQQADGVSYHCFNCGFKTSWQQGRNLSHKMRTLFRWLNVPDDTINKVALDVMRLNEGVAVKEHNIILPGFNPVSLPEGAVKLTRITDFNKFSLAILEYMATRNLDVADTDYYWSSSLGMRDRLIIPFYFEKRVVGWTARTILPDKKPKYLNEMQPGYVYGLDAQTYDKQFAIVCEGPVDALHVGGCALMGSEINPQQSLLLNRLNKDIIVVPDRDKAGKKLVEDSIELGWNVSMPDWAPEITDINDAVNRYGRLATLYSIVKAAESSPLKIRLKAKKWF